MVMFNQGQILDAYHDEKRKSIILNLDCVYLSSSIADDTPIKYSYIRCIEIKDKYKDKNLTLDKLQKWKNNKTPLGFFSGEDGAAICFYDGKDIHPLSHQNTLPLSFFNNKYIRGYETIWRFTKIGFFSSLGFIFMGMLMTQGSSHFTYSDLLLFIFKLTAFFSFSGLLFNIGNYFSFREIKKIIKHSYNPSVFKDHKPSNSINDVFRRKFTFNRTDIDKEDVLSAVNQSDLSATDKLLLQDLFDKNKKKLDIHDIEKIKYQFLKSKV